MRTYSPKPDDIDRQWLVIDADDVVLGRLATHAAQLLRGKHKPMFAPNTDTGDYVIVINAEKVVLTRNKLLQKKAYKHSGYPGGLKEKTYAEMMEKAPKKVVEKAVLGMLPKTKLGRAMYKKLKVYTGPGHPHTAQQPKPYEIKKIAQ